MSILNQAWESLNRGVCMSCGGPIKAHMGLCYTRRSNNERVENCTFQCAVCGTSVGASRETHPGTLHPPGAVYSDKQTYSPAGWGGWDVDHIVLVL